MKTAREWYETVQAGIDWDNIGDNQKAREIRYVADIRQEAVQACGDAVAKKLREHGCDALTRTLAEQACYDAVPPLPDPHREARGRTLYEALNPDGTPWDEHEEQMHERYRAAAEAVRDG